jgi:hypothetical protein
MRHETPQLGTYYVYAYEWKQIYQREGTWLSKIVAEPRKSIFSYFIYYFDQWKCLST